MSVKIQQIWKNDPSKSRFLLLFLAIATITACESSKMKDVAIQTAKSQFGVQIRAEMDESGVAQHELNEQYFSFIIGHTEFEVLDIDKKNEQSALVKLNMETIPKEFRNDLSNIVVKLQGISTTRFNMGEAILLIKRQRQARFDTQVLQRYVQIQKKDGEWVGE